MSNYYTDMYNNVYMCICMQFLQLLGGSCKLADSAIHIPLNLVVLFLGLHDPVNPKNAGSISPPPP